MYDQLHLMIECSEFFKNLHKKLTSYNIGRKYNRILHFYGPMIGFDFVGKKIYRT